MKKFFALAAVGVVVVAGLLATPTRSKANNDTADYPLGNRLFDRWIDRRRGYSDGYSPSYWSSSPRFYRNGRGAPYYYPDSGASYSYPYTAYYPQEQAVDVNAVLIRMHVPSGARVWVGGEATVQTGTDREFVSPAISPGREYVYQLRVQWDENNKPVERKRDVKVHAGDRINLTFGE